MTSLERLPRADLLLASRADRINDELDQSAADGWLVYDFRGSNPAFGRLLGAALPSSTRRAFLFVPRHGDPRLLVRALGIEVLSSADALASVVAAWDAADVASHQRAAQALERGKDGLFAAIKSRLALRETWTEFDAQQHLARLLQVEGLEFDHAPIVAVGAHAGDPHYAPARDVALPIRSGDLVLTDLWGHEAHRPDGGLGAYADITWMATAADYPIGEHVHVWKTVRDARDAAVRLLDTRIRAGQAVQGGEVDRAARGVIEAAGYGAAFTHRTGHSIGWLGAHGDGVNIDDFETHDTRLLRPGAAFSIEPGIYLPTFGVRSEINAVITPEGKMRVTTPPQRDLVRLA